MLRLRGLTVSILCASFLLGCPDETVDPLTTGSGGDGGGSTSTSGGGGDGGGYHGPCTPLEVGDTSIYFASVARAGLQAPVLPPLGDLAKTRLTLELYEDDGSGSLPPLAPGEFSFADSPDDNYGTCQHCVLLVGFALDGTPKRAFYPKNGTMTLTQSPADIDNSIVGHAHGMELVEVIQNPNFT
jgi:hypothetical protein